MFYGRLRPACGRRSAGTVGLADTLETAATHQPEQMDGLISRRRSWRPRPAEPAPSIWLAGGAGGRCSDATSFAEFEVETEADFSSINEAEDIINNSEAECDGVQVNIPTAYLPI